jgi:ribosome-binding protein aMBF1 (putative translation factor)
MSNPSPFDIDPVVFKKRQRETTSTNYSHHSNKIRKLENNEITKIDIIDKKTARILQQGRTAKKLTQKQLSHQLQIPIKVIQEIENGKAQKNRALWQKIARFLNVKI